MNDTLGAPKVAIINETMAKYFFGDTSPIGRRMGLGRSNAIDIEIVGVVEGPRRPRSCVRRRSGSSISRTMQEDETVQLTFYVRARPATPAASARRPSGACSVSIRTCRSST